jgi:hypothetical protein
VLSTGSTETPGIDKQEIPMPNPTDIQADRITIGLTKRSVDELAALQDQTGLSKTDLINRSIGLYKFITEKMDSDWDVVLQNQKTGENLLVHLQ